MTTTDITFDPAPTCADKLRAKDLEILEEDARRHGVPAITSAITARAPVVARPVVETPCLTDDDMYDLERHCESLPGSGLRRLGSSLGRGRAPACLHYTGTEMYGHDRDGPFWLQICKDGYVTAAHGRGVLHLHAAAVAEELRWHDRIRYAPLHSALRPKGSLLVDVARLAEVARSMPGCTVELEAKAVPNTVQLVFAAPPRVETGVRYGVQADDVVIDINVAGHMRARSRRRNMDGGLGGFSGSKPEIAEKVREQLLVTQAAWSADAADDAADFGANYLFTSLVLT